MVKLSFVTNWNMVYRQSEDSDATLAQDVKYCPRYFEEFGCYCPNNGEWRNCVKTTRLIYTY